MFQVPHGRISTKAHNRQRRALGVSCTREDQVVEVYQLVGWPCQRECSVTRKKRYESMRIYPFTNWKSDEHGTELEV